MANIKQQKKRIRTAAEERIENLRYRSTIKTLTKRLAAAVEKEKVDSPRGAFTISKAHNPVQDMYLRQVVGKENKLVGIASKALADPARGCKS